MRIMISTRRGAGHLGPLIPFAKAFLRNNDEVVVIAPQTADAMIAAAGLDHLPYPDPPDEERDAIFAEARQLAYDDANERVLGDDVRPHRLTHAYPHVLGAMRSWRPDAVLYDVSEFAAAAGGRGARHPGGVRRHHRERQLQRLRADDGAGAGQAPRALRPAAGSRPGHAQLRAALHADAGRARGPADPSPGPGDAVPRGRRDRRARCPTGGTAATGRSCT